MSEDPNKIELPAPTCWPIVAAFGLDRLERLHLMLDELSAVLSK